MVWYTGILYAILLQSILKVGGYPNLLIAWSLLFGWLLHRVRCLVEQDRSQADHPGGLPVAALTFLIFRMITSNANPALERPSKHQGRSGCRSQGCGGLFNPVSPSSRYVWRAFLAQSSVKYRRPTVGDSGVKVVNGKEVPYTDASNPAVLRRSRRRLSERRVTPS